jgi:hypothetical protein
LKYLSGNVAGIQEETRGWRYVFGVLWRGEVIMEECFMEEGRKRKQEGWRLSYGGQVCQLLRSGTGED